MNALDQSGYTPLLWAVREGPDEAVEILLKHGAGVSVTDLDGNTPMHIAILEARERVVEMLLQKGVDWGRSQRNRRGLGYLETALEAGSRWVMDYRKMMGIMEMLLEHGAMEDKKYEGSRLLHRAIEMEIPELAVELLLRYGADANGRNQANLTPLQEAVKRKGGAGIMERLIRHGASPYVCLPEGVTLRFTPKYGVVDAANSGTDDADDALQRAGIDVDDDIDRRSFTRRKSSLDRAGSL